ncbi:LuxR C-terminal-related transcriptional regulator [Serratia aquatilis]|uniref:LuxR C-terminal-related transcriptional regulator n=1 Tax=Serratia aquatilis TaxID=1737515 RepID=A0ABV6EEQ0_9GAMM
MRRKKVVLQSTCNFMRTGLETFIRDTDLSVSLDIVESTDSLEKCEGILNSLMNVNLIVLTFNNHDYNLTSLLQLVGEYLPKTHPNSKVILIGDIAKVNSLKYYFSRLSNVSAILDKTIAIDELRKELLGINTNKAQKLERTSPLLSMRELQVLQMLLDGDTATKIADNLQLNFRTVSHHKRAALAKLGVRSLCPLVSLRSKDKHSNRIPHLMRA